MSTYYTRHLAQRQMQPPQINLPPLPEHHTEPRIPVLLAINRGIIGHPIVWLFVAAFLALGAWVAA